jgi:hypothetical protein
MLDRHQRSHGCSENLAGSGSERVLFPRRIRRGLIEAKPAKIPRDERAGGFRGEFAAASLKQLIADGLGRADPDASRRITRA